MAEFKIYSRANCPFCDSTKRLLESLGHTYVEIDVTRPGNREAMLVEAPGARTVPQILIGDHLIGGYDKLKAIHDQGSLQSLIEIMA